MGLRVSVMSGLAVLTAVAGLAMAAPASATTFPPPGYFLCRTSDVYADGLYVHTCITGDGGNTLRAVASTRGSNNTSITLCAEVVDVYQNVVPGSRHCAVVPGPTGTVWSNPVGVRAGVYYGVSYFTSPTYYYGGETPQASVS